MKKLVLAAAAAVTLASGCAVVSGKAGHAYYFGWAFGEKASTSLVGLNITDCKTEYRPDGGTNTVELGVGIERAGSSSETKLMETLGRVVLLGLQAYTGAPVRQLDEGTPAKTDAPKTDAPKTDTLKADAPNGGDSCD